MVENPPSNAGDVGLIPGQGTWIPHASEQLTRALQLSPDVVKKKKKKKASQDENHFLVMYPCS